MSGIFGVASKEDCFDDLFFGTDYHCHLGTKKAGLAVFDGERIHKDIHRISEQTFRSQLIGAKEWMRGKTGIGVISDYEPQPLIMNSHLGTYAIVHVGVIKNAQQLVMDAHREKNAHFSEMHAGEVNPIELIATLINKGRSFVDGIELMQNRIEGSSSVMLLTEAGIILARDKVGRTPIVVGKKSGATAATFETSAFPNLDYEIDRYLGPGEIGIITSDGYRQLLAPRVESQFCSFLWVYYGFPTSDYEGINVDQVRHKCGAMLAEKDIEAGLEVDYVAGIPDSGTAHAIGYANRAKLPFKIPYHKYTPTWARSFMPQEQKMRDMVANMKLIPNKKLIEGQRILFCEDSIVRGTQLRKKVRELFDCGAREVHMRPACPPLIKLCKFLNFSRSRSEFDLATLKAMRKIEGREDFDVNQYLDEESDKHKQMVEVIREDLGLTSLKFQKIGDMVRAIGLDKDKVCLGCWR